MGRRWGRADISSYADRFDVPAADGGLSVTFLGVASLLVSDGTSAVLTDGFFSRPSLPRVLLRRIAPDPGRIHEALGRAGVTAVDAVVPVHTHYDHALDSATVAAATGARLLGGASAAHIGVGGGLPEDRIAVVPPGRPVASGRFTLTLIESTHCPPDRYPGVIERPVVPPVRTSAYRCGEAWSILLEHASGRTALIQGSAGFVGGALTDRTAEVAYLGIGQLGHQDPGYIREYWRETVQVVGARRVVLIHWDDFFRPLTEPLRTLPHLMDDLDASMQVLVPLAREQDVPLHFPTLWRREDPWAGL
ncbi:L-ascorbate metabolism protein UlaG, beta-lactamase superfamily [Geodermatophilus africanus]|uniref:L-ascorbate metabolism protein UlaG, beta-lactamase superfamily n=1 Tax=Geodermatophilus africanus TaxID=1137993 RepID=A0A1H3DAW2_9ACTN|nr:MBL fold metallo-hydrolase [Geodermatophilus africanus]SDX63278.1 L-ascorbate metabolism protein UlaG, beta-lactamase superfamily [Geodermatophilus africanus]